MYNFVDSFNTVERFRRGKYGVQDKSEEPTFLTFSIDFVTEQLDNPINGLPTSPLFAELDRSYSTASFLESIGMKAESARIDQFRKTLLDIQTNKPWYFQSISGLDKLWAMSNDMSKNYKGKDIVLEIETLEAYDLKISYLADLYKSAVYDNTYRRELVPENLKKFEVNIYVAEFRNITDLVETWGFKALTSLTNSSVANLGSRTLDLIRANSDYFEKHVSFQQFNCQLCEFDFSDTFAGGSKLSVHTPEMATNKFKIKVDWFREQHSYTFHDILTKEYYDNFSNFSEDQWKKDRLLTLNGVAGAISTVFAAGKNLTQDIGDLVRK